MADPREQAATQLRNIEQSSGTTLAEFTAAVSETGLDKHGQILKYLKAEHGLTHGNANLVAGLVRQELEGGPPPEQDLLAAQYSGNKAHLLPIHDRLCEIARSCGNDVEVVVQKTGVSFRRNKQFALVQAPSSKRVQLGLNLGETPDDPRISQAKGMCSHRVDLTALEDVDDAVGSWIGAAYDGAG